MKRITFITSEFPPFPGGIGNHAFCLAKELQKKSFLVEVITNHRGNEVREELDFDKKLTFKVKRIKRSSILFITYFVRILTAIKYAKNADIVLASGKFSLWVVALVKILYKNKKYVCVVHGSEINAGGKLSKYFTHISLKKMDKIVAVSNFTKQLSLNKNKDLQIDVILNGFEPLSYEKSQITLKGKPSIITVGNVTNRKGQQNVINSLVHLVHRFPDIHYHIVGIPTEKKNLVELANELNVSNLITFHGVVDNKTKSDLLKESDVFFMLSSNQSNKSVEGFGIALIEANSLGKPVIGSRNSGIEDAIKDGYNGILVDPQNIEEVMNALDKILKNYNTFSENAVLWSENFKWEKVIENYEKILLS